MWAMAIGILFWIFRRVPAGDAVAALSELRPLLFAIALVVFSLLTLLLDAVTHYWLFNRFNPRAGFMTVFRARGESYLLLSLGTIFGQGSLAWLMARGTKKPLAEVAGSLIFLMFNSLLALIVIPTVIAPLLLISDQVASSQFTSSPEWKVLTRFLLISWPLCIALILFWVMDWQHPIRQRLKQGVPRAFDQAGVKDYLTAVAWRALQFVLWAGFTWAALRACRIPLPFSDLFMLGPLVGLISAIPTPGRLGTTQGAWFILFQHLADPAALVAFSLLWSVSTSLLRWLIGAIFILSRQRS